MLMTLTWVFAAAEGEELPSWFRRCGSAYLYLWKPVYDILLGRVEVIDFSTYLFVLCAFINDLLLSVVTSKACRSIYVDSGFSLLNVFNNAYLIRLHTEEMELDFSELTALLLGVKGSHRWYGIRTSSSNSWLWKSYWDPVRNWAKW